MQNVILQHILNRALCVLRPLDARNLRILCMVFMTVQIMSGTQKLSQNNTPEPFNRVLEAFFDPWQRFKKISLKIWSIFWIFLNFWFFFFKSTNNQLDGSARLKYCKKQWPKSDWRHRVEKWLFWWFFSPFFAHFLLLCCNLAYLRYFWYRGSEVIFSHFHRLKYTIDLPGLARTHRMKT